MAVSEAQKKATAKYEREKYDKILTRFTKGTKERIVETGAKSVNSFIIEAVEEKLSGKRAEQAEKIEKVQLMDEEYYDDELPFANDQEPVDLQALQELLEEKRKQFQAKEPGWTSTTT